MLASFDGALEDRLREIMQSLTRHLHAFVTVRRADRPRPVLRTGSPLRAFGATIAEQAAGTPAWVHGRVLSLDGAPISGAELDIWQNGSNRLYAVQDEDAPDDHLRGKFVTGDDGRAPPGSRLSRRTSSRGPALGVTGA